ALAHGTFINPSPMALNEAETYIYYAGGIDPACLIEESASARKTHGDRVMADALCFKGMKESRIVKHGDKLTGGSAPKNSFGGRYREHLRQKKAVREGKTFDFRNFRG
ncbi:hypothetical protein LCGC14_2528330, partial [marine sediment metagenome]